MADQTVVVILFSLLLQLHATCADVGYFWHVTDYHYDFSYSDMGISCNKTKRSQQPGQFGDQWCDSPWALVRSSVKAMVDIQPDVDFLLWSGDTVLHAEVEELSYDINAEILDNVTTLLKTSFPGTPVYGTLGNNDYWPDDQFPARNNRLYNDTLERWREWIGDPVQDEFFRKGAYYSVLVQPGLRLVALNTNLYYRSNKVVLNATDPGSQFQWLNETLSKSESSGEKVILTTHIPPGVQDGRIWWHAQYYAPFLDIIRRHADVIIAMHAGHHHSDAFKILYNYKGQAAAPIFLAPSVTPWRYVTPTFDGPAHNPGVRLVAYDRETGKHLSIAQYYLDLASANKEGTANWHLEYNTTQAYAIVDLTTRTLVSLANRLKSPGSGEFARYWRYHNVSPPEALAAKCDGDCHAAMVCSITEYEMDSFGDCKEKVKAVVSSALSVSAYALVNMVAKWISLVLLQFLFYHFV